MSKLPIAIVIAALGAGAYYYLTKPEATPTTQLETAETEAATEAQDATAEAASSLTEQAAEAASAVQEAASDAANTVSEQAAEAASTLANQATDAAENTGEQVASLAAQGQDLFNSWLQDGMLTAQNFDYDAMVASVQDSELTEAVKTGVIAIFDRIKASPETLVTEIQKLQSLLTQ